MTVTAFPVSFRRVDALGRNRRLERYRAQARREGCVGYWQPVA
jgi:hypothetical protein